MSRADPALKLCTKALWEQLILISSSLQLIETLMARREVTLKKGREPLQIPVPKTFEGQRSSDDDTIFVYPITPPVTLTMDEIAVVAAFVETLPYAQGLVFGATMLDADDPLMDADHDRLDEVESAAGLPNSRQVAGSGQRSERERLLIIRESGHFGSDQPVLASA
jgi:hypothetical protein